MPILVKDFTWQQSSSTIYLRVPLKGIHSSKVDVFISEKFLKLNFSPFIFEVYLLHNIDEKNSTCIFTDTEALIELNKVEYIQWDDLEGSYSKSEKIQLKLDAIDEVQNKTKNMIDEKIKKKDKMEKYCLRKSMENEARQKQKVKDEREKDKSEIMDNFENWRINNENKLKKKVDVISPNLNINSSNNNMNLIIKKNLDSKSIKSDLKNTKCTKMSSPQSVIKVEKIIPPIRNAGSITVTFTERVFLTPSRESSNSSEQEWLKKNYEARKASGFAAEDLRPEESDPLWCKKEGDNFFNHKNYNGAINAYTHGIKLSDKLYSLYSNRAAAHYALGNFHACVEDCSTALELLTPKCEANLKIRVICIVRRAAALTRIGMLSKAIDEMKYAAKLQPENDEIKQDLYNMEKAWEQDPDSE